MYCDECSEPVEMDLVEYMQRKEQCGAAVCSDCRSSWVQEVEPLRPHA